MAKKKIKKFTKKPKIDLLKLDENLKKLDPMAIDKILMPLLKGKKKKTTPSAGVLTGRRAKRTIRGDITKKMNMGGVMKNRGGTFKGVF